MQAVPKRFDPPQAIARTIRFGCRERAANAEKFGARCGPEVETAEVSAVVRVCPRPMTSDAAYKRPRMIQFVDDLPKTSTGKVLRRELIKLDSP
jgi:acyl-CoA synthetase (AMP-forming)/AMP-acid ligase II